MAAYYNEIDKHAAAWLRELIKQGLIANGDVDERSIIDVQPSDVKGYDQCHWFAGIAGWSYALRLAGVPDDYPVWTASLPCQPFSVAGKQLGKADERHLLPHFLELVRQCKPNRIFGEQVPGAIRHGWLDDLYSEMEQENYSVGASVLTAAGAGAFHIRQRLYWVANSNRRIPDSKSDRSVGGLPEVFRANEKQQALSKSWEDETKQCRYDSTHDWVANSMCGRQSGPRELGQPLYSEKGEDRKINRTDNAGNISNEYKANWVGHTELHGHDACTVGRSISQSEEEGRMQQPQGSGASVFSGVSDTNSNDYAETQPRISRPKDEKTSGNRKSESITGEFGGTGVFIHEWGNPDWVYCRDNKYRPIKPGLKPLVDGVSEGLVRGRDNCAQIYANETQEARTMRLKGYGNAIVPQVAATFITAAMSI